MKTIAEQIECAQRELRRRHNLYPEAIQLHTVTPEQAAHGIECMEAIVETLKDYETKLAVEEEYRNQQ